MAACAGRRRSGSSAWTDDLYVRSFRGHDGRWFNAAQQSHQGAINAGGVRKQVQFVEATDPQTQDAIDQAYRSKYGRYGARYLDPMVAASARATTLQLVADGDEA